MDCVDLQNICCDFSSLIDWQRFCTARIELSKFSVNGSHYWIIVFSVSAL